MKPFFVRTIFRICLEMRAVLCRRTLSVSYSRRGGDYHPPTAEQMRGAGNNWLSLHTFSAIGWFPAESNTTYETELARISKELGWDSNFHLPGPAFTAEERRYWHWNDKMFAFIIGFWVGLMPFMPGKLLRSLTFKLSGFKIFNDASLKYQNF